MRANKKSTYQIKKEKLQRIKEMLWNLKAKDYTNEDAGHVLQSIWEIVKYE